MTCLILVAAAAFTVFAPHNSISGVGETSPPTTVAVAVPTTVPIYVSTTVPVYVPTTVPVYVYRDSTAPAVQKPSLLDRLIAETPAAQVPVAASADSAGPWNEIIDRLARGENVYFGEVRTKLGMPDDIQSYSSVGRIVWTYRVSGGMGIVTFTGSVVSDISKPFFVK